MRLIVLKSFLLITTVWLSCFTASSQIEITYEEARNALLTKDSLQEYKSLVRFERKKLEILQAKAVELSSQVQNREQKIYNLTKIDQSRLKQIDALNKEIERQKKILKKVRFQRFVLGCVTVGAIAAAVFL